MPKTRQNRPDDELRALSHHLLYEIEMFAYMADTLKTFVIGESSQGARRLQNAVLESWALHVRNLLSFLYDDRAGARDVIAADFLDQDWPKERGAEPEVLRAAHQKAAREIAHISDHRLGVAAEQKAWQVEEIRSAIATTLRKFSDLVPPSRVQDDFPARTNSALPQPILTLSSPQGLSVASTSAIAPAQLQDRDTYPAARCER